MSKKINQSENNFILSVVKIKQLPLHCGPACMEMLLRFYGIKNVTQKKIGRDMNVVWGDGCLPSQVIRYLKKFKIFCRISRKKYALEYFEKSHQPIILGEASHFTILIGKKKNKYIIIDPCYGRCRLKSQDYFSQDINEYVIVIETMGVNYEKENKN